MQQNVLNYLENDLHYVEAVVQDLKSFLLGEGIYWSLSKVHPGDYYLPNGTLGGLLMRLHRLNTLRDVLPPEQRERLSEANDAADEQLDRWQVQAEAKAVREIKARIGSWLRYVEELEDRPKSHIPEYPTQAEGRTVLAQLIPFAGTAADTGVTSQLATADHLLRTLPSEYGFVWAEGFRPAYPENEFWWLYLTPLPEDEEDAE